MEADDDRRAGDASRKVFAIGDIHGCYDKLMTLLDRIPLRKERDTLVFLGDYINRGPDSKKVLEALLQLSRECANVVFLRGNHDQALLEYAETGDVELLRLLRVMGVEATAASYGSSIYQLRELTAFPGEHLEFLCSLASGFVADDYLFIHADVDRQTLEVALPPGEGDGILTGMAAKMLSSRRLGNDHARAGRFTVVFGHIPFATPLVMPDRIGIDTGAAYGGYLTAVELPDLRFYHA